ncbi:radical SAM protein [candidate division KSB1 bacterium]|nr:MAG: radical SAM protein [candidate division KSB1 bacterium]MCE7945507.1 radical SAM protein [Chlorobi bacterium CHB1]MDL1876311.1 B12-binding domain-containing radical SAM protein [Cytophagia bacterium CHB2]
MTTTKSKILLYNPRSVFFTMPLGLLAIASNLDPERFEVIIVDGRLQDDPLRVLQPHLQDALCLGLSVLTGAPIRDALHVSRAVKALRPDLPIVWGGWHPSLFPTECLAERAIDITVQGQGEETFRELVEKFAANENLRSVAGIAFREGKTIYQNAARPLRDMNDFPPARYELIPVEKYYARKNHRQLDYISSIGCYFRCAFCADPYVFKRKWNAIAPERMGAELEHLWHRFPFDDLNFQDETFFTYADRVAAIAEELLRRNLKFSWAGTLRADQGVRMSDDLFALCKRSGLRRVMIGVESGDQQTLNWLKKDITIEQVFETAERCKRFDLGAIFPFIVGFPQESPESVEASLQAVKRLRAMSPKFETVIFFYQPYPGSPIADLVRDSGYPMPQSLEEWAAFDYVESYGPWVPQEKWERVQRFKFYQRFAWSENGSLLKWPIKRLARLRCEKDFYEFPIEKRLVEWLKPATSLS